MSTASGPSLPQGYSPSTTRGARETSSPLTARSNKTRRSFRAVSYPSQTSTITSLTNTSQSALAISKHAIFQTTRAQALRSFAQLPRNNKQVTGIKAVFHGLVRRGGYDTVILLSRLSTRRQARTAASKQLSALPAVIDSVFDSLADGLEPDTVKRVT